ncbi:retinaldehyde-binding protein 1 [Bombyx mori]|uniref:CRAL-TRIO domain-containing protein n=1 Tax=Bombyx mori TaxID=7091 RepID=A0A8R1WLP9_BOMMO|nr:retinaldehyde-binding protein 1 [Bombyx mori]
MESLPSDRILKFNANTLEDVRKEFHLEKRERVIEAIDILEDWVKKQNHFLKKDFSREYLERTLITTKGLVERAKTRIDNLCTFKTLMPNFFEDIDVKKSAMSTVFSHAHMPKLTKDNYRIYLLKVYNDDFDASLVLDYYKYIVVVSEYLKIHDYCKGFEVILDYSDVNVMNFVTKFNPVILRQAVTLITDGYGMRIKGVYIISPSKTVDLILNLFKQVVSTKLASRLHVHKTIDTVTEFLDKDLLPIEYGGNERSLKELHNEWLEILSSDEHNKYLQEMNKATTNESCRQTGKFNEQYLGLPGSFRSLSVD